MPASRILRRVFGLVYSPVASGAIVCDFQRRGPAWLEPSSIPSPDTNFLPNILVDACQAKCEEQHQSLPCAALALAEDGCWLLPYGYDDYLGANRIRSSAEYIFYTPDCYGESLGWLGGVGVGGK